MGSELTEDRSGDGNHRRPLFSWASSFQMDFGEPCGPVDPKAD
jgi:hypothetical protein